MCFFTPLFNKYVDRDTYVSNEQITSYKYEVVQVLRGMAGLIPGTVLLHVTFIGFVIRCTLLVKVLVLTLQVPVIFASATNQLTTVTDELFSNIIA